MSEVNRPSHSEQARADAIKASQKKVKDHQTKTKGTQKGAQQQANPQGTEKKLKSAFDNVLDTLNEGEVAPMIGSEAKFDGKLQEIQAEDQRRSSDDSGEEEEPKTKEKGEKSQGTKSSGTGVKGRVSSKEGSHSQGQKGSSSGGEQEGGQKQQTEMKQMEARQIKQDQLKPDFTPAPPPAFSVARTQAAQAPEAPGTPRELPKTVLDQIIQSVTISRRKDLGKEIQIEFKDNFFNGLSLKVTAKGDEVSVEFIVPNRDVEATFKQERDKIAAALGEKNIALRSINITMR